MQTFLNIGCGSISRSRITGFSSSNWKEVILDVNEIADPNIFGSLTDMNKVESDFYDAIYSVYNLDLLYAHEFPKVLKEFYRVLKEDGFVFIRCSDIQKICELIAEDKLFEPLYESPTGLIYPVDVLYGNRSQIKKGNTLIAKKIGFTYSVLNKTFLEAGFKARYGGRMALNGGELAMVAFKQKKSEEDIKEIADPIIFG